VPGRLRPDWLARPGLDDGQADLALVVDLQGGEGLQGKKQQEPEGGSHGQLGAEAGAERSTGLPERDLEQAEQSMQAAQGMAELKEDDRRSRHLQKSPADGRART
jgi:hypothetical protein